MERFDIHLDVPRVNLTDFDDTAIPQETSAQTAVRVSTARALQLRRQGRCNGRLDDSQIDRNCTLSKEGRSVLERAMKHHRLSARSRQRIMKVARTIADLAGEESVSEEHVFEAVGYRCFDKQPQPAGIESAASAAGRPDG